MDKIKKKKIIKIIVAVVIFAVIISGIFIINANQIAIKYRILYAAMPDSIDTTVNDDVPLTLYKRLNADYDSKKDDDMNFMEFYYYDENGEEVVIPASGKLVYDEVDNGIPFVGFSYVASEKIDEIISAATPIAVIVALLIFAGLIVLWFFRWSKKQDAEKEKKYGNNKPHKNKKKK